MSDSSTPGALRTWFIVHFVIDMAIAVPLFIFPGVFLGVLGWNTIDPLVSRIVAAALFGIGIESFLCRNAGIVTFRNMLNLKIIWSGTAVLGTIISILLSPSVPSIAAWTILFTFLIFNIVWIYWRDRINRIIRK